MNYLKSKQGSTKETYKRLCFGVSYSHSISVFYNSLFIYMYNNYKSMSMSHAVIDFTIFHINIRSV